MYSSAQGRYSLRLTMDGYWPPHDIFDLTISSELLSHHTPRRPVEHTCSIRFRIFSPSETYKSRCSGLRCGASEYYLGTYVTSCAYYNIFVQFITSMLYVWCSFVCSRSCHASSINMPLSYSNTLCYNAHSHWAMHSNEPINGKLQEQRC